MDGGGAGGQAAEDLNSRGVAVGDEPGGRNYVLQRPLEEGPPVVVVVDLSHAITDASQRQLDADLEAQLDFILSLVRPCRRPAAGPGDSHHPPQCPPASSVLSSD